MGNAEYMGQSSGRKSLADSHPGPFRISAKAGAPRGQESPAAAPRTPSQHAAVDSPQQGLRSPLGPAAAASSLDLARQISTLQNAETALLPQQQQPSAIEIAPGTTTSPPAVVPTLPPQIQVQYNVPLWAIAGIGGLCVMNAALMLALARLTSS